MAWIGSILVTAVPVLLILKSLFLDRQKGSCMEWFLTVFTLNTILLPIASGLVVTSSIQKEYQDKTLRNILTAPTSRRDFITAKLTVWFLWHLISMLFALTAIFTGVRFLFPSEAEWGTLSYMAYLFLQNGLYTFAAILPVLWIAVRQQALFYPSILTSLGFALLEAAGLQVSEDLLLPASLCPWTAVAISSLTGYGTLYFGICTASVLLCATAGFTGAYLAFLKQDQ